MMGIHAEGPIIASLGGLPPTKPAGDLQQWTLNLLDDLGPALKVMTIAPSCEAKTDYQIIKELHKRDVAVSLGHDKLCSEKDILGALAVTPQGKKSHVTHTFNVMNFHHRENGLANFCLTNEFPNLPKYEGL